MVPRWRSFWSIILVRAELRAPIPLVGAALEWSEGETGGALFARRGIEGIDGVVEGVGDLPGAGGGFASAPSAFLLGVFENGRRHRSGNLEAGADSVKAVKGDCASRRFDIVLLMASMPPQSSLSL